MFASHQLVGPAADWWDAYVEAHEEPDSINWQEFRTNFRSHHVPHGVMKLKKKEFQDLKQGSMTVSGYVTRFTQLSRYAPNEVDTDEKKQECFLNGLNDGLAYALEARDFVNFQAMVDKALVLENRRGIMDRKRKSERQTQQGSSSSKHTRFGSSSAGPIFRPGQQVNQYRTQPAGQGFTTPQRQVMQRPNNSQPMRTGNQNLQRTQTNQGANQNTAVNRRCYNCGEEGHFANQCPKPRQQSANNQAQTPVPNRNANSAPVAARQNYARG